MLGKKSKLEKKLASGELRSAYATVLSTKLLLPDPTAIGTSQTGNWEFRVARSEIFKDAGF